MTTRMMKTAEVPYHRSEPDGVVLLGGSIHGQHSLHSLLSLSHYTIRESSFGLIPHEHGVAGLLLST